MIPGDGIGPEVVAAAQLVLRATGARIEWEEVWAGESAFERTGASLPESTLSSIRRTGVALKGPHTNPRDPAANRPRRGSGERDMLEGFPTVMIALRRLLDVYANVRHARSFAGVPSRYDGVDILIIREGTEDRGKEQQVGPDAGIALKFITRGASERIARFAFDYAAKHGRRSIAVAHRADVLRVTDGLFLSSAVKEASQWPDIHLTDFAIDNICLQLVRDPTRFDIVLAPLTYGDFLSDLCAGIVGGLGFMGGANYGDGVAIFEAAHGSAPRYAGQDSANPIAMILTGAMLLEHIGEADGAARVRAAVDSILAEGVHRTREMEGSAGTREIADAVAARVAQLAAQAGPAGASMAR